MCACVLMLSGVRAAVVTVLVCVCFVYGAKPESCVRMCTSVFVCGLLFYGRACTLETKAAVTATQPAAAP